MDLSLLDVPAAFPYTNQEGVDPAAALNHGHVHDSSMPDTLNWGTFLASQPGHDSSFPPIPSQCLMPSRPPSTASSSQARYLRPFAGKGLQTLSGAAAAKVREPLLDRIKETSVPPEAAAPSGSDTVHASFAAADAPSSATMTAGSKAAFRHLSNTVQGHEQRLDRLENASFSVAGHEECQEKHDHADLRVTELEFRVEEVEKMLNSDGSSIGSARRRIGRETSDDATASVASVSTTAAGASELYSQLQALQAQVSHLQSASAPTYNNPWELEVVFLPFPLKGIWIEARDIHTAMPSGAPGRNSGDWTQMPNTGSGAAPETLSTGAGPAYGDLYGPDWLLPRACAPGGMVDKRLRSRGLVKTVAVRGPDARSVQVAINTAFADVLRVGSWDVASRALVHRAAHDLDPPPLGLQQAWVPLRKIHKDSRLRFLAPAELVTPSLWDHAFLTSSVVMRASGMQRLYITQREAYLQDHPVGYQTAPESCWTWQKLRTLSRVYPDSQSSSNGEVPEADALEACWVWNDRLDEAPSSMTCRPAQANRSWARRSSTSPSQQYFTGVQSPILPVSPAAMRGQSPFTLKDRQTLRPERVRTNSVPPAAVSATSSALSKRRVTHTATINPYERRPSPLIQRSSPRPPPTTIFKRRQSTRSPTFARRTTPRWSQVRLSRSPSLAPFAQPFGDDRAERRTTPFCYATPYSNAPPSAGYTRAHSRGPVRQPNGYYDDEDEADEGVHGEDAGSETDPYDEDDSEVTNRFSPRDAGRFGMDRVGLDIGMGMDIDVYEDELSSDLDTGDEGRWHTRRSDSATRHLAEQNHAHGQVMAPEDEPWPGIEDVSGTDGENVDPMSSSGDEEDEEGEGEVQIGEDVCMDAKDGSGREGSSCPSEYPSTQRAWHLTPDAGEGQGQAMGRGLEGEARGDGGVGFRIHEDSEDGDETQWV